MSQTIKNFQTIILPKGLSFQVLKLAHDELFHNDMTRTDMLLRRLFYWKGLKFSVNKYFKQCLTCQKRNVQVVTYAKTAHDKLHFTTSKLPVQFMSMELIGPFEPSMDGQHYDLTVIFMLTAFTFFCCPEDKNCYQNNSHICR